MIKEINFISSQLDRKPDIVEKYVIKYAKDNGLEELSFQDVKNIMQKITENSFVNNSIDNTIENKVNTDEDYRIDIRDIETEEERDILSDAIFKPLVYFIITIFAMIIGSRMLEIDMIYLFIMIFSIGLVYFITGIRSMKGDEK